MFKKLDTLSGFEWHASDNVPSVSFICGHCGNDIASNRGYRGKNHSVQYWIRICHYCFRPTFFDTSGFRTPGSPFGQKVEHITDESVASLYDEARAAMSVSAYTCAVLACRKLLMHIAVAKGAAEGESFVYYVEFLAQKNFVPPDAKPWVDHIRKKGNEANHQINIMKDEEAKELISFCEMLLKLIYEFPARVTKSIPPAVSASQP